MPDIPQIQLNVNGKDHAISTDPQRSILEVLREDLQLTGTKYGCGEGACGACSVLMDGKRIFSCSTPVSQALGKKITTIEGLADGGKLHPVQEAFLAEQGFQCGYCTPGMCIGTVALLSQKTAPTDEEIVKWMNPQLCRCCGYPRLINAVRKALEMAGGAR